MGVVKQDPADPKTGAGGPVDGTEVEMATGLSLDDVLMLEQGAGQDVRAIIASKFAAEYDRLNRSPARPLTEDLIELFAKDRCRKVRLHFAEGIKASRHLSPIIAAKLACDDLDIAAPMLEFSPVLSDADLEQIILEKPEAYGLVIAGRRPLSGIVADLLIEKKGTKRIVCRLIENSDAALSDETLDWIFEWGQASPDIAVCLMRRPNLPFKVTQKHVKALGMQLNWNAVITQSMTKGEAVRLQGQISGPGRCQFSRHGKRTGQTVQRLQDRYEAGTLTPATIIGFLRDRDVALLEFSFVVVAKLDLRRVRNLLYGSDKRGLVALCLRTGFTTSEYLAFRMALGMIERGAVINASDVVYETSTAQYAKAQFEDMRAYSEQIDAWIEGRHGAAKSDPRLSANA